MNSHLLAIAAVASTLAACTESPVAPQADTEATPQFALALTTGVRLFVDANTCGTRAAGETYCWGEGSDATVLGVGATWSDIPKLFQRDLRFAQIQVGANHGCGLDVQGRAWCWGQNNYGQLGDNSTTSRATARLVKTVQLFTAIEVGESFTCAMADTGRIYCWGANDLGQLGIGTDEAFKPRPTPLATTLRFRRLSVGTSHACALRAGNTNEAFCWGSNSFGQLGHGYTSTKQTAPSLSDTQSAGMEAGGDFTCNLSRIAGVWCWGNNAYGQLGRGTIGGDGTTRLTPVAGSGRIDFVSISAGATHMCGLNAAGTPYCWGDGRSGQLGVGFGDYATKPTRVYGSLVLTTIGAGDSHTCGLRSNGSAVCWGLGSRLGAGGASSSIPVEVFSPF